MMKKYLILPLIILCFWQNIFAEGNNTIIPDYLSSSMRWIVMTTPEEMDSYIDTLCVSKDSIVNGKTYKVIARHLLRQEGHKIYYLYPGHGEFASQECLIYDFDPQVGDSIVVSVPGMDLRYYKAAVVKVDATTLLDGRSARRISYSDNSVSIEYVGDTRGGFLSHTSNGWIWYHNQQVYDGTTLLYESPYKFTSVPRSLQPNTKQPTKHIINGQLLINTNGQTFDALGHEQK